jgi:CheY-like chemotaxis protein
MKPTILAIDDDQPMLWLIRKVLKDYNVVTKTDGLEAMMWLTRGNHPDLIILDKEMPNLDGHKFLRGLRGSGMYKNIPVLFVSSWIDASFEQEIKALNVKEFVRKPFDPEILQEVVSRNISKQPITA